MVATLNQPIVTDYHPIRNRPLALLLFLVMIAVSALSRDLTAAVIVAALGGTAVFAAWLLGRTWSTPDAGGPWPD